MGLPALSEPTKIVAVGRRYVAHAAEDGSQVRAEPLVSLELPIAVIGPGEVNPDQRLDVLVGKTAGAICRDSTLPYSPPYSQVIDAASHIAYDNDMFMSAWVFAAQWQDGSTVWRSPDNAFIAIVSADNEVRINPTGSVGWI